MPDSLPPEGPMPLLIVAALLGLCVVIWLRSRRAAVASDLDCSWRPDGRTAGGALFQWQCRVCGEYAFNGRDVPPSDCRRRDGGAA